MDHDLNEDLIWSLRALAQNASTQLTLFPDGIPVADELALDFDDSICYLSSEFRVANPDIVAIDELLESKGGIEEFWTEEAFRESKFWAEIRVRAREALSKRDLPVSSPKPVGDG